ncbi:hypothetical protein L13192_06725 [Pyrenophora tritici-repentis]|nr:hypothetical protein L13192_06725 [Pyrenophora tritici-repentis]
MHKSEYVNAELDPTDTLFLNEWRTIMLKDVIASNPDKTIAQCLNLLIDKLHKLY